MVDLKSPLRELALFAGAGGGILGGKLLGWQTVCAVEWEPYAACVLAARQNDGLLPPFPIWDDIQTFDGRPWRGIVDVISGGFPCQDISSAGKGAGIDGKRSGMWHQMARVVSEVRPDFVFVENSPMLTSRGGTRVLADLTFLGYDARWIVMGASDVGAPHQKDRFWLVADSRNKRIRPCVGRDGFKFIEENRKWFDNKTRSGTNVVSSKIRKPQNNKKNVAHTQCLEWKAGAEERTTSGNEKRTNYIGNGSNFCTDSTWWESEPDVGRVAHGMAAKVDRLKALGNGQVPLCAAEAWRQLNELLSSP